MLTLYQRPRRNKSNGCSSSDSDVVIPPGFPYLTRVNGRLVMAREKKPKTASAAVDLLGEVFGVPTSRIAHRRTKSLEMATSAPLLIGGIPYVSQAQQQLTYTTPLPQQPFSSSNFASMPMNILQAQPSLLHPPAFKIVEPNKGEFEQLRRIDAHFRRLTQETSNSANDYTSTASRKEKMAWKQVCARCGRLRSRKYHHDNPPQEGLKPTPAFCRKCQRDDRSTSPSDDSSSHIGAQYRIYKKEKHRKSFGTSRNNESATPTPDFFQHTTRKSHPVPHVSSEYSLDPEEQHLEAELHERRNKRERNNNAERSLSKEESGFRRRHFSSSASHPQFGRYRHAVGKGRNATVASQEQDPTFFRYVEHSELILPENQGKAHTKTVPVYFEGSDLDGNYRRSYGNEEARRRPSRSGTVCTTGSESGVSPQRSVVEAIRSYVRRRPVEEVNSLDSGEHGKRHIGKENRNKKRDTTSLARSEESAQRRRLERNMIPENSRPWGQASTSYPKRSMEADTVTENYMYQSTRRPHKPVEKQSKIQEIVDKALLEQRVMSEGRVFETRKNAARYYREDWERPESIVSEEYPVLKKVHRRRRGYRKDALEDSEFAESDDSYEHPLRRSNGYSKRDLSPLSSQIGSNAENSQDGVPSSSLGSSTERRLSCGQRTLVPRVCYAETLAGRTDSSILHHKSREQGRYGHPFEDTESVVTEAERAAETEVESRHVKFDDEVINNDSTSDARGKIRRKSKGKIVAAERDGSWDDDGWDHDAGAW